MSFLMPSAANAGTYAALNLFAGGAKAFGQYQQGQQQNEAYNYNADIYRQKADATRASSTLSEIQQKKILAKRIGEQTAAYAAAGVNPMTGSPVDTLVDSLSNGYLDMAISKYNDEVAARGNESAAAMAEYAGAQAKRSGVAAAGLSLLEAGAAYGTKTTDSSKKKKIGE